LKFRERKIPDKAIKLWRQQIEQCQDDIILSSTASYKFMSVGFRSGKVPVAHLRSQLLNMLSGKGEVQAPLLEAIRRVGYSDSIIKVFSIEAIEYIHEELSRIYGEAIYVAMLVDDREEVQELGNKKLIEFSSEDGQSVLRKDHAEELAKKLRPFIDSFLDVFGVANAKDPLPEANKNLDSAPDTEVIACLRGELEGLKRDLKKTHISSERHAIELSNTKAKLEKIERSKANLLSAYRQLEGSFNKLSNDFRMQVETEVERLTNEKIVPWLPVVEAYQELLDSHDIENIESRARHLLNLQAQDDKVFKTKSSLRQTQKRLQSLREEITFAIGDAIMPRRDLQKVLESVEKEIDRISLVLDPAVDITWSIRGKELFHQIDHSQTLDELAAMRLRKNSLIAEGVLSQSEVLAISDRIHVKSDFFYREHSRAKHEDILDTLLMDLPATLIRKRLGEGQPLRLIIDGHNVLFTLVGLFGRFYENGVPADEARKELIFRVDRLGRLFPSVIVDLWFDSPTSARETVSDQLNVFYSGGAGSNRADNQIVSALKAMPISTSCPRFLVSDDRELGERCRIENAVVVGCDEFSHFLKSN
jgi:cell division protein FtsB